MLRVEREAGCGRFDWPNVESPARSARHELPARIAFDLDERASHGHGGLWILEDRELVVRKSVGRGTAIVSRDLRWTPHDLDHCVDDMAAEFEHRSASVWQQRLSVRADQHLAHHRLDR